MKRGGHISNIGNQSSKCHKCSVSLKHQVHYKFDMHTYSKVVTKLHELYELSYLTDNIVDDKGIFRIID